MSVNISIRADGAGEVTVLIAGASTEEEPALMSTASRIEQAMSDSRRATRDTREASGPCKTGPSR